MSESIDPNVQERAKLLVDKLLKGKEIHDAFVDIMREEILINGKSMSHWENRFRLDISSNELDPSICKDIDMQLIKLNQEASFYLAFAESKVEAIESGGEQAFRDKFVSIVETIKQENPKARLPSKDTLEYLARAKNSDLLAAHSVAKMELRFWKNILSDLDKCRKIVENATWNNKNEFDMSRGINYGPERIEDNDRSQPNSRRNSW